MEHLINTIDDMQAYHLVSVLDANEGIMDPELMHLIIQAEQILFPLEISMVYSPLLDPDYEAVQKLTISCLETELRVYEPTSHVLYRQSVEQDVLLNEDLAGE